MSRARTDEERAQRREYSRRWRAANPERSRAIIAKQYETLKAKKAAGLVSPPTEEQKEVLRQRSRAQYRKNKVRALAYAKQWQADHPEKVIEAKRKWRRNNPEKQRLATSRWAKNHPVELVLKMGRHRARKMSAPGTCTPQQLADRVAYYGGLCAYCREAPHEDVDHVIPLSRGGSNWPANLRPSCHRCKRIQR